MSDPAGKTYLVVGASSGIGASVSRLLAARRATVILAARDAGRLEETLRSLAPGDHVLAPLDACDLGAIPSHVETLRSRHGVIDGMVYCVGVGVTARLRDLAPADMEYALRGNCSAFVEFVRCLVRRKPREQWFQAVGISSLASIDNEKYLTAYAAGKAAMEAAIRCLATELGGRRVRLNAVRPGFVDTPRLAVVDALAEGGVGRHIVESGYQPLGLIQPDDVAAMALYLLGEEARCINGACLAVNGGAICQ